MNLVREMSNKPEDELKAALKDTKSENRVAAAWAVSDKKLPLQKELIEMLTDKDADVRMSARRSLIVLSFNILNPDWEAQQAALAAGKKPPKPVKDPKSVDYGPERDAGKSGQVSAQKKWTQWFTKHGDKAETPPMSPGSKKQ